MLKVDDRKPAVGEVNVDPVVGIGERTVLVRTTVVEAAAHHLGGRFTVDLLVGACNTAHTVRLRLSRERDVGRPW